MTQTTQHQWDDEYHDSYPTGYLIREDGYRFNRDTFEERTETHLQREFHTTKDQATDEQIHTADLAVLLTVVCRVRLTRLHEAENVAIFHTK